jgi:hypothetical protein
VVRRELIALSGGRENGRPVLGMFLGGAGLADSILYCRNKIYPLGLPNGLSHVLTAMVVILTLIFGIRAAFLPPRPKLVKVSLLSQGQLQGRFSVMIVTTLQKLLIGARAGSDAGSGLKLMMVDHRPMALLRAIFAGVSGKLDRTNMNGVHVQRGDEIRIEGGRSSVILDGELFHSEEGRPIVLKHTAPVPFLRLAA